MCQCVSLKAVNKEDKQQEDLMNSYRHEQRLEINCAKRNRKK